MPDLKLTALNNPTSNKSNIQMYNFFVAFWRPIALHANAKFCKIMKLSFLIILAALLQVSATTKAQKINLEKRNIKLTEALRLISNQAGYSIIYSDDLPALSIQQVSINAKNASLKDALDQCFTSVKLNYVLNGKIILVIDQVKPPARLIKKAITISGKITDEKGITIPGVSIKVKGASAGTSTDNNGFFSLKLADENATLIISAVGYITQEIIINGRTVFDITLKEDVGKLSEVVVVGYGTQKKENLTGAVSTVKVDDILGNRPVSTTGSLLQGTVPGLNVSIGSGEPGSTASFNIRGATDIGSNSNNNTIKTQEPFVIVDNVPFNGPLNLIDPNDIETITVLKDAGSAAIYGARSAFGVILITTKKGLKNQPTRFNYSNNLTLVTPMNLPKKASVLQTIQSYKDMGTVGYWTGNDVDTWLDLVNKYNANPEAYPDGSATINGLIYPLAETDAIRNVVGDNAWQFLHNLSVSGGSEKITYRLSAGTVKENGIIVPESKQDQFKRYNLRSFVGTDITKWFSVQLDASYYSSIKSYPANDGFGPATVFAPYFSLADSVMINGQKVINGTPKNIVTLRAPTIRRLDDTRLTGRGILKPFEGLQITGEYTFDNLRGLITSYDKVVTAADARNRVIETTGAGLYRKVNDLTIYKTVNVFANYEKQIEKHNISVLAGYNQEENLFESTSAERNGVISAEYPSLSQAAGTQIVSDAYSQFAVAGAFSRINYNYDEKYLFSVTGRYDASSKFPENHRNGFFPSVSVGWAINKEKFMSTGSNWLNLLKPRASYGSVGNQSIDNPFAFLSTMDAVIPSWLNGNSQVITLTAPGLVSNNFTWASVNTLNVGLDVVLFKNRLTANFDWYKRETRDMLYEGIQLPAVLGTIAPLQNVASLESKGFELQIGWKDKINQVSYRINANLSDFQSTITKIKNEAGILDQYYVGQKLGEIWGYTTDRLYTVDDFVEGTLTPGLTGGTLKPGIVTRQGQLPNPGDVMFRDLDGNGVINAGTSTLNNAGDRSVIGNSTPRYHYGINGGVSWKALDLSFVITGVIKQDQWRANGLTFPNFYQFGTIYSDQLDYWTPTNQNAFFGRTYNQATGNQPVNQSLQSRYLLNGEYLRIRNITLAYTLPIFLTKKLFVDRFQTFVSVENVVVFDHMPNGLDPDITRAGVQCYEYPFLRQFSFGINLSF
jgi:TonB-linked SusC/RagA family outer membrane protein